MATNSNATLTANARTVVPEFSKSRRSISLALRCRNARQWVDLHRRTLRLACQERLDRFPLRHRPRHALHPKEIQYGSDDAVNLLVRQLKSGGKPQAARREVAGDHERAGAVRVGLLCVNRRIAFARANAAPLQVLGEGPAPVCWHEDIHKPGHDLLKVHGQHLHRLYSLQRLPVSSIQLALPPDAIVDAPHLLEAHNCLQVGE